MELPTKEWVDTIRKRRAKFHAKHKDTEYKMKTDVDSLLDYIAEMEAADGGEKTE